MKLFVIVCLALIAAVNARPGLPGPAVAPIVPVVKPFVGGTYTNIDAARNSAKDIALAGEGLDKLEGLLDAFSKSAAAGVIETAELAVEAVATPIEK